MRRTVVGSAVGVVASVGLGAAMLPLRSHLSIATTALVLVIPVVGGVVVGGFAAGLVSVVAGFLVYDFAFIPPYNTLTVGAAQNWVALGVYAVVMLLVAQVVARLDAARAASRARAENAHQLRALSELLLAERTLEDVADLIVRNVRDLLGLSGAALLLAVGDQLEVVASSGASVTEEELTRMRARVRIPVSLTTTTLHQDLHALALATSGRPVGILVLKGSLGDRTLRELLPTLANQLALALERAQLHERAIRAEVLEEVDRLRDALVGAVSHDLRTPLTTIKVASTTLLEPSKTLSEGDMKELHSLIDVQTDRLTRLVTSLLDMTRLEAGVLEVQKEPYPALDLIAEAVAAMRPSLGERRVDVLVPEDLPAIDVDHVLLGQVLMNLLDNAHRHAPAGSVITVAGQRSGPDWVTLSVSDKGPGVPPNERESIFESFVRFDTGGRAGLGLALAKTFVEAHGGRVGVEDVPEGGARFVLTVPVARTGRALAANGPVAG